MQGAINRFLSASALAMATAMPPLGQQRQIAQRANRPGEVLRYKPKIRLTRAAREAASAFAMARVEAAEAKRERKNARRLLDSLRCFNGNPCRRFA